MPRTISSTPKSPEREKEETLTEIIEETEAKIQEYARQIEFLKGTKLNERMHSVRSLIAYGLEDISEFKFPPMESGVLEATKKDFKSRAKRAFMELFTSSDWDPGRADDRELAKNKLIDFLKGFGVEFRDGRLFYKGNPIGGAAEVVQESINKELDWLDPIYEKILDRVFSKFEEGTTIVYPAIGGDKSSVKISNKNNLTILAIDPRTKIEESANCKIIKDKFYSYGKIKDKFHDPQKTALFIKGIETLVPERQMKSILDEFDGKYIIISGTGHSGILGEGVPDFENSQRLLNDSKKFKDITENFFTDDEIAKMDRLTNELKKSEWATGNFPATTIRIYEKIV